MHDPAADPIAVFIHGALVRPGLETFASKRPDASKEELQAASMLAVLLGLAAYRMARLSEGLDTVKLIEGCSGTDMADFDWLPTKRDTLEARERAIVSLGTQPAPEPQPAEEPSTTCRWGHFGNYL